MPQDQESPPCEDESGGEEFSRGGRGGEDDKGEEGDEEGLGLVDEGGLADLNVDEALEIINPSKEGAG